MRKHTAFSLAEVMITLGIIGVVAAMILPAVINNYKVKTTVTKLKKFYSVLSQSYLYAVEEYGEVSSWDITGRNTSSEILVRDRLFKNAKVLKTCDNFSDSSACGLAEKYYLYNGTQESETEKGVAILFADGSSAVVLTNTLDGSVNPVNRGSGALSEVIALIIFDINAAKAPNTYGKDVFIFYLTNQNIMPQGTANETEYPFSRCRSYGYGCTAWVVYIENMDYLKCSDLSWDGKHKCN